jgi:peptidoglycan/xylan/chitin deacetylase (PgdA/CDA1 family)
MANHPGDLAWLQAERDAGRLAITWVNHTENHFYRPREPLDHNFLLLPGTDVQNEIFQVEQRLLDLGEVPSVFFRFPGLVSSPELVDQVLALGLIPLGSSAWLAKQQNVRAGAIVLTHANGNEPQGLEILERWDGVHRSDLVTGQWHWLGLADWRGAVPPAP